MRRRECILGLGAVVAAFPLAIGAEERKQVRRLGILLPANADDSEFQTRLGALQQGLAILGWSLGQNLRIDTRWGGGDAGRIRMQAAELIALAPDVLVAHGGSTVGPVLQLTRTLPVVFPTVVDPVGGGFVNSLARPGGNATGFVAFEYSLSAKWLELLKQIAPAVTRVAVLRDTANPSGPAQFAIIQAAATSLGMEVRPIDLRAIDEVDRSVATFAHSANGGLIVVASGLAQVYRDRIVNLASKHNLPAIYYERFFVSVGGLVSYGPDYVDQYRRAASYVDRILRGEKPSDLPVQAPTKYELVVNLKAAKAIGLTISPSVLARADEVIE